MHVWESDQEICGRQQTTPIILIGNKLEAYVDTLTPSKAYKMRVLAFSNGADGRMSSSKLKFQMGKNKVFGELHPHLIANPNHLYLKQIFDPRKYETRHII